MIKLSQTLENIQPSITLALNTKAKELKAQGKDIINLTVGEPDFDTPEHIKAAGIKAIQEGHTKYTAVDGTPALKKAIQEKFMRENQLHYNLNQIIATAGAKKAIYLLCQALLNPDDEVIIPAPYWVSYPNIVLLAKSKPVIIPATIEQNYKITAKQLEQAITNKTRLIMLNTPSNPTGVMYSHEELKALAEVLKKHPDILIMSDDIYEHLVWDKEPPAPHVLQVAPELYDRTIIINGVSKTHAMTGWRLGYAAGPTKLIQAMKKIQSQSTSNPTSIAQAAAIAALSGNHDAVQTMIQAFKRRHELLYNRLKEIKNIRIIPSQGTFYSLIDVRDIIEKMPNIHSDVELAEYLLNHLEIAVVPGSAFGAKGTIRISFAVSDEHLATAIERLKKTFS